VVFTENGFELLDEASDEVYKAQLDAIPPLEEIIQKYQPEALLADRYF